MISQSNSDENEGELEDMGNIGHLVVFSAASNIPMGFSRACDRAGHSLQQTQDPSQLKSLLATDKNALLIVDAGNDENTLLQNAKLIIRQKEIHSYPIIFIGHEADSLESTLERYFALVVPLITPCEVQQLLDAVQYIIKRYPQPDLLSKVQKESSEDIPESEPEDNDSEEQSSQPKPLRKSEHTETLILDPNRLPQKMKMEIEELERGGLLPEFGLALDVTRRHIENTSAINRSRLGRLSFLSKHLGSSLGLDAAQIDDLKAASFLYSRGTKGSLPRMFKANYLVLGEEFRKDFVSFLKNNALEAATTLRIPSVGALIASMARLIGEEESELSEDEFLAASVLVGSDLIERLCFPSGFFSSAGSYTFLKHSNLGNFDFLHPELRISLARVVVEASERFPRPFAIPSNIRFDEENMARARSYETHFLDDHQQRVSLSELAPGMRIAIPLTCFDGRPLLDSGIELDEDLINRLWRLASIRPLIASSIVVTRRE